MVTGLLRNFAITVGITALHNGLGKVSQVCGVVVLFDLKRNLLYYYIMKSIILLYNEIYYNISNITTSPPSHSWWMPRYSQVPQFTWLWLPLTSGQKFQKVENEENWFFAITSSKLAINWFCKKYLVRNRIFHNYCFIYVL